MIEGEKSVQLEGERTCPTICIGWLSLCQQHFHNKYYVAGCYLLLLVGKKVILVVDLN